MRAREEKSNSWKITKKNVYWNYRENEQRMIYLYMEAGAGEVEDIGNGVEENKRS
jgi:CCR4-NOT transcriptional regulation complex NOT5 subunit